MACASNLLLPSACSVLLWERQLEFDLPPIFTTDNHPLHTEPRAARILKSMSFAAAR
ncbi:hypothetical protein CA13_73520 [Planctomycetes bacterium CA13]|uniref:Uncharacterized protein n=1 Tax=Novipirellula herctigrandis TaxID=2527986 RepID=A0A5C5YLU0_9BACT|nr:hypothetical protein CA13_73520 [Planctomycetes bacterium CA13]